MDTRVAALYPAESANETVTERVAGRYRVRKAIGRGRLGEIFVATDERGRDVGVERQVALQLLPDAIAFDDTRFAELKAGFAGLLVKPHPNLVTYHDIGRDARFGYIVMEYLEGASLRTVLDHEPSLPLSDVAPALNAIGSALDFLHARSISHGNVSPASVFVTDDLEFRLLDVVPFGARNAANDQPAGAGIADDIYDFACLAYEMLTGRHPYNFHDRAHAARAGLVPDRIDSLPEREWRALERALLFRGDSRPRTIAEFLRQFGIRGNERLRPGKPPQTPSRPQTVPAPAPVSEQTFSRPAPRTAAVRAERDPRRAKRPRETGSLLLFLVLIALGAWSYTGEPQADVAKLLDAIGPRIVPVGEPRPASPPEAVVPAIVESDRPADDIPAAPEASSAGAGQQSPLAVDDRTARTALPAEAATDPAASGDTRPPADSEASESVPAATGPVFDASFVTVSESDIAARLTVRLPDESAGYYWWTRPHDARPEQDFVAVSAQPVRADDAGQTATLLVPVVNDGRPEPLEDFFVHVGVRDAEGRLVPADTIRVDIVDDD